MFSWCKAGSLSQKRWQLCYTNLTEHIFTLHNYLKKKHYRTFSKSITMKVLPWNGTFILEPIFLWTVYWKTDIAKLCASSLEREFEAETCNYYPFQTEESNFILRYVRLCELDILRKKWLNYLQTVETLIRRRIFNAASDLGLHCLPVTLLGVARLKWVNMMIMKPCLHYSIASLVQKTWHVRHHENMPI